MNLDGPGIRPAKLRGSSENSLKCAAPRAPTYRLNVGTRGEGGGLEMLDLTFVSAIQRTRKILTRLSELAIVLV